MKHNMVMPKLGESITEGTILKWLKSVGDPIEKDETILEISTDKVDSEIPAAHSGILLEILAEEGDVVDVGKVIAVIESAQEEGDLPIEAKRVKSENKDGSIAKDSLKANLKRTKTGQSSRFKRFYSPLVLNIAAQNNISTDELNRIEGSGLEGRVRKQDVLKYLEARQSGAGIDNVAGRDGDVEIVPMNHIRKSIAKHMVQSQQISAQVHLYTEADMNNIYKIRQRINPEFKKNRGYGLSYMPFITDAVVKALKKFPLLNAVIDGENILIKKYYNIGIAVAVGEGLIVPNIFNADNYSISQLATIINDLSLRARTRKLKAEEVSGGTFSISNFGVYGTTIGFPIINQPQSAILGVGAVKKRAVVIDDAIAIRPTLYLALTIDHRLIDGAMGAQFLEHIKQILEKYDPTMEL